MNRLLSREARDSILDVCEARRIGSWPEGPSKLTLISDNCAGTAALEIELLLDLLLPDFLLILLGLSVAITTL